MFGDSSGTTPRSESHAESIARAENQKAQLQAQLQNIEERRRELDAQEQLVEGQASELEGRIRALAKEESLLLKRKNELKESAREIGNRRTEILNGRKQLDRERNALHAAISGLDQNINRIRQQMAHEQAQPSKPEDQRAHPRLAVEVEVSMHTQHNFYTGLTENLSEGGLFVATYEKIPVGTAIALTVKMPNQAPIKAEGTVRWVREHSEFTEDVSPGIGVQFTELKTEDRRAIESFIKTRAPLFYEDY